MKAFSCAGRCKNVMNDVWLFIHRSYTSNITTLLVTHAPLLDRQFPDQHRLPISSMLIDIAPEGSGVCRESCPPWHTMGQAALETPPSSREVSFPLLVVYKYLPIKLIIGHRLRQRCVITHWRSPEDRVFESDLEMEDLRDSA